MGVKSRTVEVVARCGRCERLLGMVIVVLAADRAFVAEVSRTVRRSKQHDPFPGVPVALPPGERLPREGITWEPVEGPAVTLPCQCKGKSGKKARAAVNRARLEAAAIRAAQRQRAAGEPATVYVRPEGEVEGVPVAKRSARPVLRMLPRGADKAGEQVSAPARLQPPGAWPTTQGP